MHRQRHPIVLAAVVPARRRVPMIPSMRLRAPLRPERLLPYLWLAAIYLVLLLAFRA